MTADRPVEHLLTAAARLSGCLDPAALATALETAGAQGGRWLDTVLDAGCLADETGFYRALADSLGMSFTTLVHSSMSEGVADLVSAITDFDAERRGGGRTNHFRTDRAGTSEVFATRVDSVSDSRCAGS